jgi:hypothetical protein
MSDFLTALAARTLGTIPVVLPRQPSRFEPASPGAESAPVEEEQSNIGTDSPPNRNASRSEQHRDGASPGAREGGSTSDSPISQSPRREARPTLPPIPGRARNSNDKSNVITAEVRRVDKSGLVTRDDQQNHTFAPDNEQARANPSNLRHPRNFDRPRERVEAVPAVHVTIGRVEVRAIHRPEPAPTPPRKPVEASRVTLGDYLRQRRS